MPPDNDVQAEIEQLEQRFAENSKGLVFAHLADAYRRAAQYAKAEGLILHGLRNHPSYTTAYNVLGRVYLDTERYADAHAQFSKVLELDPQNLIALRALGDLAVRGGRLDDARVWYERMLQVDPRNEEAKEELRKLEAGIAGVSPTPAAEPSAAAAGEIEEIRRVEPETRAEEAAPVVEGDVPESLPWEPGPEAGLAEAAALEAAEDATAPMAGAEPVEATPAEPKPEVAAREPTPGLSARGSIELDLGDMEEWTPGFLRDEDLAGEGGGDLTPDELFAELGAAAAAREEDEAGPGLVTETMAELYAQQGLYEDAIDVYRRLSEIRPNDEHIRNRMAELRQLAESVAGGEEVAELFTEPPAAEFSEVSDAEVQAAAKETLGGFTFDDEAPVAGMEQLDPFAASFDVLAMRVEPAAPRVPEMQVGLPAADVRELEPVALEELEETVALEELREEVALEGIQATEPFADVMPAGADVTPPVEVEPPALALATPEPAVGARRAAEPVTIEEYLAGLLAFSPELTATPQTGGAERPGDEGRSELDAATSDDMEAFQAWLRSLKR